MTHDSYGNILFELGKLLQKVAVVLVEVDAFWGERRRSAITLWGFNAFGGSNSIGFPL